MAALFAALPLSMFPVIGGAASVEGFASTGQHSIVERTVLVAGVQRTYVAYLPPRVTSGSPIVFAFHGGFGRSRSISESSALHKLKRAAKYVIVYPTGYRRSWNVGSCCGYSKRHGIDDVAFFDAMLEDLKSIATIDVSRIYVTGFSNGAMMSYHLACNRADTIAAIAPVAGALQGVFESCQPARAVPILHIHGMDDQWAPFFGGIGKRKQAGEQQAIPELIDFWRNRYGCTGEEEYSFAEGARCVRSTCGDSRATVTLCTINGLGHQWPGNDPQGFTLKALGNSRPSVAGSDEILKFFDSWSLQHAK